MPATDTQIENVIDRLRAIAALSSQCRPSDAACAKVLIEHLVEERYLLRRIIIRQEKALAKAQLEAEPDAE